jgi:hypothetical protein
MDGGFFGSWGGEKPTLSDAFHGHVESRGFVGVGFVPVVERGAPAGGGVKSDGHRNGRRRGYSRVLESRFSSSVVVCFFLQRIGQMRACDTGLEESIVVRTKKTSQAFTACWGSTY